MNNPTTHVGGDIAAVRARLTEIAHRDTATSVTVRAEDLRAILAVSAPPWKILAEEAPKIGNRVIGATDDFVIGDVYHGRGPLVVGRMAEEGYAERQTVWCWRYSQGDEQVEAHLIPVYWQPLPEHPNPTPKAFSGAEIKRCNTVDCVAHVPAGVKHCARHLFYALKEPTAQPPQDAVHE